MRAVEIPHLRTSERRTFKKCPQQWQWDWREGLTQRFLFPNARWFGTGIHAALAERYKYTGLRRGRNVLTVWRDYVGDEQAYVRTIPNPEEAADESEWVSALELGEAMLGGYLDTYGRDARWYNIAVEQTFEIPIPYPHDRVQEFGGETLVLYNGTFDGVRRDLENEGSLWLWENKTAASIRTDHLGLDDQAGSYWALAGDWMNSQGIKFSGKLDGIMYDFLRKAIPDDRPKDELGRATNKPVKADYVATFEAYGKEHLLNHCKTIADMEFAATANRITVLGAVSARQEPANFLREPVWRTRKERRTQIQRIQNEALWIQAVTSGALPLIKSGAADVCRYCDFKNMCELHEQGSDWEEFRDATYAVEDKYADHRKSAAE